jgi:hypothetical protein
LNKHVKKTTKQRKRVREVTILVVSISLLTISVIVSLSFVVAVTVGTAALSSTLYLVFALLFVVMVAVLLFLIFFSVLLRLPSLLRNLIWRQPQKYRLPTKFSLRDKVRAWACSNCMSFPSTVLHNFLPGNINTKNKNRQRFVKHFDSKKPWFCFKRFQRRTEFCHPFSSFPVSAQPQRRARRLTLHPFGSPKQQNLQL